jgi:hypothetical protein
MLPWPEAEVGPVKRQAALLVVLVASLIAACGDPIEPAGVPPGTPVDFISVRDLHAAIEDAGLSCPGFEQEEPRGSFGMTPLGKGVCDFEGERIELEVYEDRFAKDDAVALVRRVGCDFARGLGYEHLYWVSGRTWMITVRSETDTRTLAQALGAQPVVLDC